MGGFFERFTKISSPIYFSLICLLLASSTISNAQTKVVVSLKVKTRDVFSLFFVPRNSDTGFNELDKIDRNIEASGDFQDLIYDLGDMEIKDVRLDLGQTLNNEVQIRRFEISVGDNRWVFLPEEIPLKFVINQWLNWSLSDEALFLKVIDFYDDQILDPFLVLENIFETTKEDLSEKPNRVEVVYRTNTFDIFELYVEYKTDNKKLFFIHPPIKQIARASMTVNTIAFALKKNEPINRIRLDLGTTDGRTVDIYSIKLREGLKEKTWAVDEFRKDFIFNQYVRATFQDDHVHFQIHDEENSTKNKDLNSQIDPFIYLRSEFKYPYEEYLTRLYYLLAFIGAGFLLTYFNIKVLNHNK